MPEKKRKPPKGGWYKGPEETVAGRYKAKVSKSRRFYVPGLSDPADRDAPERWSGDVDFIGETARLERPVETTVWRCEYKLAPGAEAPCRAAAEKAAAAFQAYYDRTGERWEVLRRKSWVRMPKVPPKEEL